MRRLGIVVLALVAVVLGANAVMAQEGGLAKAHRVAGPFGPGLPLGATCYTEDITGVQSWDPLGDPSNDVISADVSAACGGVSDVGWTGVVHATVGASWGSEARLQVSASDGSSANTIQFTTVGATGTYGPNTGNLGAGVALLGDMILRMEFFETFDDVPDSVDANYLAGDIELQGPIVPVELMEYAID